MNLFFYVQELGKYYHEFTSGKYPENAKIIAAYQCIKAFLVKIFVAELKAKIFSLWSFLLYYQILTKVLILVQYTGIELFIQKKYLFILVK